MIESALHTSSNSPPTLSQSVTRSIPMASHFLISSSFSPTLSIDGSSNQSRLVSQSSANTHLSMSLSEIRLFSTLHQLILQLNEQTDSMINSHFFSLNLVELFVYLLMPLMTNYLHRNEKEFLDHADLCSGMELIWKPLLAFRQPNLRFFNTLIKSVSDSSSSATEVQLTSHSTLVSTSSITQPVKNINGDRRTNEHDQPHAPLAHLHSICSTQEVNPPSTTEILKSPRLIPLIDHPQAKTSMLMATHLDVGVLRVLFTPSWSTDGYIWCFEYLHQRLIDISDYLLSSALFNGTPIRYLRPKSFSMSYIDEQHKLEEVQDIYRNEKRTHPCLEQQRASTFDRFCSGQRFKPKVQRYTSFYRKIR
jgi:hypothetical protein